MEWADAMVWAVVLDSLEEGIAPYELMRHAEDPRERAECRDRARAIFLAIGTSCIC